MKNNKSLKKTFFLCLFILWGIVTLKQTVTLINYFKKKVATYSGVTTETKYRLVLPEIYPFAQLIKQHLTVPIKAKLISDLDFTVDPGMIFQRAFAYFLYPIDIRGIRKNESTAIIYLHRKNALKEIPDGYEIAVYYNNSNFVVIKKIKNSNN